MKTDNVTGARLLEDRIIELTISDPFTGKSETRKYATIRAGICWPTTKAPAYLCVVAQEHVVQQVLTSKPVAGNRILLAEQKSEMLSLSGFYENICALSGQLMVQEFYCDLPEERWACGYQVDLEDIARARNANVRVLSAYDSDNLLLGISRIKGAIDKQELLIPDDSLVYAQLRSLTRDDLESEEALYTVNGLRHVMGSYYRTPPALQSNRSGRLQQLLKGMRPKSFMAA